MSFQVQRLLPGVLGRFRNQVSFVLIGIAVVSMLVFLGLIARQQSQYLYESILSQGSVLTKNLVISSADDLISGDYAGLEESLKQYVLLPSVLRARVFNEAGVPVSDVALVEGQPRVSYDLTPLEDRSLLSDVSVQVDDAQMLSLWEPIRFGKTLGWVNVEFSLAPRLEAQRQLLIHVIQFGAGIWLISWALLYAYMRFPLRAIQQAAGFAARLDRRQGDSMHVAMFASEFEQLGVALNQASKRLFEQDQIVQQTTRRLQAVLTNAVDGIVTLDANRKVQTFNPAATAMFGYAEADATGKTISHFFEQSLDLSSDYTLAERVTAVSADKQTFPVEVTFSHVTLDDESFYVLIIRDSRERVRFETALQNSEAEARKLALVASKTDNAVVITNAAGLVEWVNEGFTRLTGYELQDVINQRPGSVLQGPDTNQDTVRYISQQLKKGQGFNVEIINYSKTNQPYWIDIETQPIYDEHGNLSNFIAIERDITTSKAAAVELLEAKEAAENANLAKNEFLSRMSHELRTPLNAILGFAQLLEFDPLEDDQQESVARILKAGRHLLRLINEVLDISRIESGGMSLSLQLVDICVIVDESLKLITPLADARNIDIVMMVDAKKHRIVKTDPQRLNQVMINVLSNAVKYNREGGKVTIDCEELPGNLLRITVTDTGMGIPDEKLERLFVPFDRLDADLTDIEGSGIGLALTRRILQVMGGAISVKSSVGQGSTFCIDIPCADEQMTLTHDQVSADTTTIRATDSNASATVVYVEDNQPNLELIEKVFQRFGNIELRSAKQGQEGLELIRKLEPDLVLLDLHLPVLSGEDVLMALKSDVRTRDIPVLVISADATPARIKHIEALGARAYLTKPLDIQKLLALVECELSA